jgi:hypothetical protein
MNSLVDRFKSGAGKAAFEADKLRRLTAAQGAIKPLRGDADRVYFELGKLTYMLHTQGAITQPELLAACARLDDIQTQITQAEAEVESIRSEEFVEPLSNAGKSELVCPSGHGAAFCQTCGAAGVRPTVRAAAPCGNCGAALEPNAQFCANCGQLVKRCANCSAALLPGAVFCAECGTPVASAAKTQAPEPARPAASPPPAVEWLPLPLEEASDDEEQPQDESTGHDDEIA